MRVKPGTLPPLRFILLRLSAQRTNPARRGGGRGDPEAACPENYFFSFAFFSFNLSGAARQLREAKAELFLKEREIQARARSRARARAGGGKGGAVRGGDGAGRFLGGGRRALRARAGRLPLVGGERFLRIPRRCRSVRGFVGFSCLTARGRCRW